MIFHGVTAMAAVMAAAAALLLPHFLHHLPLPEAFLRFNAKILDNSPLGEVFILTRDLDKSFEEINSAYLIIQLISLSCEFTPSDFSIISDQNLRDSGLAIFNPEGYHGPGEHSMLHTLGMKTIS